MSVYLSGVGPLALESVCAQDCVWWLVSEFVSVKGKEKKGKSKESVMFKIRIK